MKYLGIDIGGTSVKIGLVTDKGEVLALENFKVAFDNYASNSPAQTFRIDHPHFELSHTHCSGFFQPAS